MKHITQPQTPDVPATLATRARVLKSLVDSADMSIRDHTVTITVDRGCWTEEDLESSMMDALKSIKANRGHGIGRQDPDYGFMYTAYFGGTRDSAEIMDALYSAMERQELWFEIEITDGKIGETLTRRGREQEG
jgi:hypothetical protein